MWESYYLEFTPEQTRAYLARIGINSPVAPDRGTLDLLTTAHQCTVPFESTYISEYNKPVDLDTPSLFDKIVTQKRGGYCFELNGAFALLLRGVGYDAYSCPCRVRMGAPDSEPLPPVLHRGTIIRLDGKKFFTDVGFGGPMPMGAVDVEEQAWQKIHGQSFRVVPLGAHWYKLVRKTSQGEEENVLLFGTARWQPTDFIGPSMYCSSPKSYFGIRQASLRREDGYISLRDNEFSDVRGDYEEHRQVTPEEGRRILTEVFGL